MEPNGFNPEQPKPKYVESKKLFGKGLAVRNINPGEMFPVGGKSMFSDTRDINMIVDTDEVETDLQEIDTALEQIDKKKIEDVVEKEKSPVNPELFRQCLAFAQFIRPHIAPNEESRKAKYSGTAPAISDLFRTNNIACTEASVLAHLFLQRQKNPNFKIESMVINGEFFPDIDDEGSAGPSQHTFVYISIDGQEWIFDASNFTDISGKTFPKIYKPKGSFITMLRKQEKKYMPSTNVITGGTMHYGVGNGTLAHRENIEN